MDPGHGLDQGRFPIRYVHVYVACLATIDQVKLGFMHDMSNVNGNDQLMSGNGQPTSLGAFILSGNYS